MTSLSLSELCAYIEDTLTMELADAYWVRAEIASLQERGGHAYLELIEKAENDPSQALLAKVRATCWANTYQRLKAAFWAETGLPLQVGMQVLVQVTVTFHAVYGLSLNIIAIDADFTLGNLARTRQQTIERLEKEGVMDLNRSLTLPTIVRSIAVISSPDAAGYEDFENQLNLSPFTFHLSLFPATMQGTSAPSSIISALSLIHHSSLVHRTSFLRTSFDLVVILRGGGATTDLSCFDDYELCSHCAQFPLPILTGIGHTRDVSILDMVAHAALKTPTALAQFLIDRMNALDQQLTRLEQRLMMTAQRQVLIRSHAIELLEQRLRALSPERIFALGYSLATVNGQPLTQVSQVKPGDTLITHLQDGNIESMIN